MAQGVWPVSRGVDGELQVSRKASRLTLRVAGSAAGAHAMLADAGEKVRPYEALRLDVLRLAAVVP